MEITFDGGKVITAELCAVKKTINNPPKFEIITSAK